MSDTPDPSQFQQPGFPPPTPVRKRSPKTLYIVVGCLGLLLVVGIAATLFVSLLGAGLYAGFNAAAESVAYKTARQYLADNPAVKAEFGGDVSFGSVPSKFEFSTNNGRGAAMLEFSVTGPKGGGTAHVELTETGQEQWTVDRATVRGPMGKEIRLR